MNFAIHTRITTLLSPDELDDLEMIEKQSLENISTPEIVDENVTEILRLFCRAFDFDQIVFIGQVFFENQLTNRKTSADQDFILTGLSKRNPSRTERKNRFKWSISTGRLYPMFLNPISTYWFPVSI